MTKADKMARAFINRVLGDETIIFDHARLEPGSNKRIVLTAEYKKT